MGRTCAWRVLRIQHRSATLLSERPRQWGSFPFKVLQNRKRMFLLEFSNNCSGIYQQEKYCRNISFCWHQNCIMSHVAFWITKVWLPIILKWKLRDTAARFSGIVCQNWQLWNPCFPRFVQWDSDTKKKMVENFNVFQSGEYRHVIHIVFGCWWILSEMHLFPWHNKRSEVSKQTLSVTLGFTN